MMLVDLMLMDKELTMSRRTPSGWFKPRLLTANDATKFERATRDFHERILTLNPADLVVEDRERLRVLLRDLLRLARKPSAF
jgi:hypothetical protein